MQDVNSELEVLGICEIASKRFQNPKFARRGLFRPGGGDPPGGRTHPPNFLKPGRARRPNFIAFLGSLGPPDRFAPTPIKYV